MTAATRYEIPTQLIATYRQMTIDTTAILDTDGFCTGDRFEADKIMEMVAKQVVDDNGDDYEYSDAELRDLFKALYGRSPDTMDYEAGLFNLICAAVE